MIKWEIKVQAMWNSSESLLGGSYLETLNVTLENGIF